MNEEMCSRLDSEVVTGTPSLGLVSPYLGVPALSWPPRTPLPVRAREGGREASLRMQDKNDAIGPLTSWRAGWDGGARLKPLAFVRLNMGHLASCCFLEAERDWGQAGQFSDLVHPLSSSPVLVADVHVCSGPHPKIPGVGACWG